MKTKIELPQQFPVTCHTKHVGPQTIFVAVKGQKENGIYYIPQALKLGAKEIIIQKNEILPNDIKLLLKKYNATITKVENTRKKLATLSAQLSGHAHKKLKIIAVTGTKGKTSTSFILNHILTCAGYKTALISSVQNKILDKTLDSYLTTEHPDYLHVFFKQCIKHNIEYVVMETAAQAVSLHRVEGITFETGIFTNFSQEHGEFYQTLDDYFDAKQKLFTQIKPGGAIFINYDDQWGQKILKNNSSSISFGFSKKSDLYAMIQNNVKDQLHFFVNSHNKIIEFNCPFIFGTFNIYNILAAASVANKLSIPLEQSATYMKTFKGTPGRLELHRLANGARCFLDYAHNPSSFEAVIPTLKAMTDDFIIVFGTGGDRDPKKRPIMGNIAAQFADTVILTSDNSRSEDPQKIIDDIFAGIPQKNRKKVTKEIDRASAIRKACNLSKKSSIIAILGKGPDEYDIVKNIKTRFCEDEILQEFK